ncbi:MAG TPA: type II toxin-antitoxin system RelE/ParE family toxin [Longimicrobium sp.]|jgi:proteic killer suppression protein
MIASFSDGGTEDVFNGVRSRAASKTIPAELAKQAQRKMAMIDAAIRLEDLGFPPGNHLEALRQDRAGQHSIRVNDQYRVCFTWTAAGAEDAEVVDYH